MGEELPPNIDEFYKAMKLYFPNIYDLKYIIKDIPGLKDVGLAKLSYEIGVLLSYSVQSHRTTASGWL